MNQLSLTRPDAVFFDFGGTLVQDPSFDAEAAGRSIYACADNPEVCSAEDAARVFTEVFTLSCNRGSEPELRIEIPPMSAMVRSCMAQLGLRSSLTDVELETAAQWQGAVNPVTPGTGELLGLLAEKRIRTAVISNFSICSETLRRRIELSIPENSFEFVITSSDYVFCKPSARFFAAGIKKAGVDPSRCWYVGNDLNADIRGGAGVGLSPVFLDLEAQTPVSEDELDGIRFLRVSSWAPLAELIRQF